MAHTSESPLGLLGWKSRLALLGLFGMAVLVLAGRSLGAVTPHLLVISTDAAPAQTLTISASRQPADDAVGRIQFYVPNGFLLNAPAVGGRVGSATGRVVMRDANPTAVQAVAGKITAISLTDPAAAYENSSCDGNQHLAAWMVKMNGGKGGALSFPIFIDATSGSSTAFGPYVLVACFRPADVATSDPARSAGGAMMDSFTLALKPFARPTTNGDFRWRSVWTPFSAGTGTLNSPAAIEAQSIVTIPTGQIVIFGKKSTATIKGKKAVVVTITGQVLVDSEPVGPGLVTIRHGSSPDKLVSLGTAKTGADGGYTKAVVLLGPHQYFQASSVLHAKNLGASGCQASFTGIPCIDATSGAGRVISGTMLVKR